MMKAFGLFSDKGRVDGSNKPCVIVGGSSGSRSYEFQGDDRGEAARRVFELIYPFGRKEGVLYREMSSLIESQLVGKWEESVAEKHPDVVLLLSFSEAVEPLLFKRFENDPDWELRKNDSEEPKTDSDDAPEA